MKNFIGLSWKEAIRNKNNLYLLLILLVCLFLLILCLDLKRNLNQYFDNSYNKNTDFRTLSLDVSASDIELLKNEIISWEHVIYLQPYHYNQTSANTNDFSKDGLNGYFTLNVGTNAILPKVMEGRNITEEEANVAICPLEFFPDSKVNDILELKDDLVLTKEKTLNKKFTMEYFSLKVEDGKVVKDQQFVKTFQIVGLYDNTMYGRASDECYISLKDMKEIKENLKEMNSSYALIVDNYENIEEIQNKLKEKDINSSPKMVLNTKLLKTIKISINGIIIMSIVTSVLLIILNIYKKVLASQNQIAVSLSVGFTKKNIMMTNTLENMIISFIAVFSASVIYLIIIGIVKPIFLNQLRYIGFVYHYPIGYLLFIIIGGILITGIISYLSLSFLLKKKEIYDLMKEE